MWEEYTWVVVCGAFLAFFVAYGIGKPRWSLNSVCHREELTLPTSFACPAAQSQGGIYLARRRQ
eukprot:scaffold175279_cov25-Prasinocladus_malaysianus.AAC.1